MIILAEEPDVQPIPIMMPCEVDAFMQGDYDLDVMIAGFGVASGEKDTSDGKPGLKRWATATTDYFKYSSSNIGLSLTHFSEFMPGTASHGDSGGPVYIRLPPPHNTWRVFGTFIKPLYAVPPWQFVEWMLLDPEVEATKILPCHDSAGNWKPGPGCHGFPLTPQQGAGGWSYGPRACDNNNVGGQGTACGAGFPSPILPPNSPLSGGSAPAAAVGPAPATTPASDVAAGCSVVGEPEPAGLLISFMPLPGLLLFRKRRRHIAAACMVVAVVAAGCSDDQASDSATSFGFETGAETGGDEPPGPIEFNPNFHNVHSGISLPGAGFDQLAVGNIARAVGDTVCCQDTVLGGPGSRSIHVYFGGGSVDHGLTFLAPRPVQQYDMAGPGTGVEDLALVDLDQDGYNDLLVVTTDGQLGVRRGQDGAVTETYFGALTLYDASAGVTDELGPMALGDLDCDGDLDVTIAAPGGRGIVTLMYDGAGAFGDAVFTAALPAEGADTAGRPRDVAVGDFDGVRAKEIVSANDDGTLTIYSREGCNGPLESAASLVFFPWVGGCDGEIPNCVNDTAVVHVLTDDVYCSTPLDDLTVAFHDRVHTYCNHGAFNPILENRTIYWDLNGQGKANLMVMRDVAWWRETETFYVADGRTLRQLAAPGTLYFDSDSPKVTRLVHSASLSELVFSRHVDDAGEWWQRMTWIGSALPESELGFAR